MIPRTLADFGVESRTSGDQINFRYCPVCGSKGWNVYVNPRTGSWYCFAGDHGKGGRIAVEDWTEDGRLAALAELHGGLSPHVEWPEVSLPACHDLSAMALAYLERRSITPELAQALHMREMDEETRIIIPYLGPQNRMIHWVGREYIESRVTKAHPKYKAAFGPKPMYMLPRWEQVEHAVLVEGPLDAIAVAVHARLPVISIGGTSLSGRIELDLRALVSKRLTIMLDGDALAKAFTVRDKLYDKYNVRIAVLDCDEDPASIDPVKLKGLLWV